MAATEQVTYTGVVCGEEPKVQGKNFLLVSQIVFFVIQFAAMQVALSFLWYTSEFPWLWFTLAFWGIGLLTATTSTIAYKQWLSNNKRSGHAYKSQEDVYITGAPMMKFVQFGVLGAIFVFSYQAYMLWYTVVGEGRDFIEANNHVVRVPVLLILWTLAFFAAYTLSSSIVALLSPMATFQELVSTKQ